MKIYLLQQGLNYLEKRIIPTLPYCIPFVSVKRDCFLLRGINERVRWREKTGILVSKLATNHHWITTQSLSFPNTAAVDTGRQQLIVSTHFGKISQTLCCSGYLVVRKKIHEEKKITFFINRDNEGKQDFFLLPLKALWNSLSVYLSGYKWSSFLKQLISVVITAFLVTAGLHSETILQELLRQSTVHKHKNTKCPDLLITGESCCTGTCQTVAGVQLLSFKVQASKKKHTRTPFWDNSCLELMRCHQFVATTGIFPERMQTYTKF